MALNFVTAPYIKQLSSWSARLPGQPESGPRHRLRRRQIRKKAHAARHVRPAGTALAQHGLGSFRRVARPRKGERGRPEQRVF